MNVFSISLEKININQYIDSRGEDPDPYPDPHGFAYFGPSGSGFAEKADPDPGYLFWE